MEKPCLSAEEFAEERLYYEERDLYILQELQEKYGLSRGDAESVLRKVPYEPYQLHALRKAVFELGGAATAICVLTMMLGFFGGSAFECAVLGLIGTCINIVLLRCARRK